MTDQKLKQYDDKLAELERARQEVEEQRREHINRNGLNKTFDGYMKG